MNLRLPVFTALFFSASSALACEDDQSGVLALSWSGGGENYCLDIKDTKATKTVMPTCEFGEAVSLYGGGYRCPKPPKKEEPCSGTLMTQLMAPNQCLKN